MPVDTAEKRINIKDLVLEEPEVAIPFDWEKDITRKDIAKIEEQLKRREMSPWEYYGLAREYKLLVENHGIEIPEPEDWEKSATLYRSIWTYGVFLLGDLYYLFPTPETREKLHLDEGIAEGIVNTSQRHSGEFSNFIWTIVNISPDEITQEKYPQIKEYLYNHFTGEEKGLPLETAGSWYKLAFPQEADRIKLDNSQWQKLKSYLEEYRTRGDSGWRSFARLAAEMKILAAEKVERTQQGIRLIMPERSTFAGQAPDLPQTRRF